MVTPTNHGGGRERRAAAIQCGFGVVHPSMRHRFPLATRLALMHSLPRGGDATSTGRTNNAAIHNLSKYVVSKSGGQKMACVDDWISNDEESVGNDSLDFDATSGPKAESTYSSTSGSTETCMTDDSEDSFDINMSEVLNDDPIALNGDVSCDSSASIESSLDSSSSHDGDSIPTGRKGDCAFKRVPKCVIEKSGLQKVVCVDDWISDDEESIWADEPALKPPTRQESESTTSCSTDTFITDDDDTEDSSGILLTKVVNVESGALTVGNIANDPSARIRSPSGKTVQFREDDNGAVFCYYSLKPIPLTEADVKNFWWHPTELEEIRNKARKARSYIIRNFPEYTEATHALLCQLGGIHQRTTLPGRSAESAAMTQQEAVTILMSRDARGFEKALLLQMDIPYPACNYCVRQLVETQTKLNQEGQCCEPSERAEILARQYREDTQVAVAWARLLAEGDALVNTTTLVSL
jgi:hypothetical protein